MCVTYFISGLAVGWLTALVVTGGYVLKTKRGGNDANKP